jgi:hypothetical protein
MPLVLKERHLSTAKETYSLVRLYMPFIFLSALLSNMVRLYSSLYFRGQISHPLINK